MANTKVTKKEYFGMIMELCKDREDIIKFCEHEIELLNKKNTKGGATKTQKENAVIADILMEELAKVEDAITITDLMNTSEVIKGYRLENGNALSNQKISAIFKQLVENGKIVKVIDKKKSYFSIAD